MMCQDNPSECRKKDFQPIYIFISSSFDFYFSVYFEHTQHNCKIRHIHFISKKKKKPANCAQNLFTELYDQKHLKSTQPFM